MDKIIPEYYKTYGQYSNYRNFPMVTDGLKPVERRVLLSAYKIARDKFVKSRQLDAYTIGHYHPHGETYGTVVTLVRQGFLIGQGNFGSNVGVESEPPAAPRYTECKLSPKMINLVFKYVHHVEWVDTELGDREPKYLPTMFPLCLIGEEYTQGIGFGYKTFIPCFDIKDLKKRLMWLLGVTKTEPIIKPKSDCLIMSKNKIVKELLTSGSAKIEMSGVIKEIPHQNKVILKSWPIGKKFESFLKKFSDELTSGMIGFRDASSKETDLEFQVIRQRNRDTIYKNFVRKLKKNISGYVSFDIVMVNEKHEVVISSVDELLLKTYGLFKNAVENKLHNDIAKRKELIKNYRLLLKIRPSLKRHMTKKEELSKKVDVIASESGVSVEDVESLIQLNIRKLLTSDLDIDELQSQNEKTQTIIDNLDNHVLEQYKEV